MEPFGARLMENRKSWLGGTSTLSSLSELPQLELLNDREFSEALSYRHSDKAEGLDFRALGEKQPAILFDEDDCFPFFQLESLAYFLWNGDLKLVRELTHPQDFSPYVL